VISPTDTARLLSDALVHTGAPLVSVILHGSAVLGGWTPGRSDLDLLVIVEDTIEHADLRTLVGILIRFDAERIGMPLEASIVTRSAAAHIRDRWPFLAHVNSHRTPTIDEALAQPGASDPDLLMHYAVARHAGLAVSGERARVAVGPVPRSSILRYLADEIQWGLDHAPVAYALLNACRARQYLTDAAIVSKIEGGLRALQDAEAPQTAIAAAIAWQQGGNVAPVLDALARAYIERTTHLLIEASGPGD
jgi:streptomycin 3"-adenylyltransferase